MIEGSLRRKVPRNMPTKRLWSAQSSVIQSTDTQTPMITPASSKPALTTSQKSDNTVARKLIPPTQSPDGVLGHKMASNSSFGMHGATLTTQFKDAGVVISGTSANAASSIGASPAAGLQMSSRPARRSFSPKQVGSGPSETNEADGRLGRGDALALAAVAQNASHSTLDVDACLQYVTTLEEEGLITFQQAISGNRAHIVLSRPCPPHRECCALECDCDHVYCALDCDCVHVY